MLNILWVVGVLCTSSRRQSLWYRFVFCIQVISCQCSDTNVQVFYTVFPHLDDVTQGSVWHEVLCDTRLMVGNDDDNDDDSHFERHKTIFMLSLI